jgi:hypothetical protein
MRSKCAIWRWASGRAAELLADFISKFKNQQTRNPHYSDEAVPFEVLARDQAIIFRVDFAGKTGGGDQKTGERSEEKHLASRHARHDASGGTSYSAKSSSVHTHLPSRGGRCIHEYDEISFNSWTCLHKDAQLNISPKPTSIGGLAIITGDKGDSCAAIRPMRCARFRRPAAPCLPGGPDPSRTTSLIVFPRDPGRKASRENLSFF